MAMTVIFNAFALFPETAEEMKCVSFVKPRKISVEGTPLMCPNVS